MHDWIEKLAKIDELTVIDQAVDVELEMAHLAYAEAKKEGGGKALLFTKPVRGDREYQMPVLMNLYGSQKRVNLIFGGDIEPIADRVKNLLKPDIPKTLLGKLKKLIELAKLRTLFPKRYLMRGFCQAKIMTKDEIKLSDLPILKTWKYDGGAFITMGQVYTQTLDGKQQNLGMYRLQVFDDRTLGLHWQIHKDSSSFFDEYEAANTPMPVSIAIGGDPLYTWCATAPLPKGVFELLLYGFIRGKNAKLVKCRTNELFVPDDADIVIEGWIQNPKERKLEGAFGDHTGYYTAIEPYPFLTVSAITTAMKPVFLATVVGKPPIEDKFMGLPTERIFLPLLRTSVPELIDYKMPENGVFHNLIVAKIKTRYEANALQAMHAFWGVGQMSFVKHAIFVGANAPELTNYERLAKYCLDRFLPQKMLISEGVLDALDHSSPKPLRGGKLGIDLTGEIVPNACNILSDDRLFEMISRVAPEIVALKQYMIGTTNPVSLIVINKTTSVKHLYHKLRPFKHHLALVFVMDNHNNDVENIYMSVWRIVNNIDAIRDIYINDRFVLFDATNKDTSDGYDREWVKDTDCDAETIETLRKKGLWNYDEAFHKKWQL
ncbi:hypothetical protein AGMMS50229_15530 [Campylobacterota bacterium]|nr:hypothetical protein AGMMS50229_15530 [Campylobacterota bacterium]